MVQNMKWINGITEDQIILKIEMSFIRVPHSILVGIGHFRSMVAMTISSNINLKLKWLSSKTIKRSNKENYGASNKHKKSFTMSRTAS